MTIALRPAALVEALPANVDETGVAAFLHQLETSVPRVDTFANLRSLRVTTDEHNRWMVAQYKLKREAVSKEWTVEGQLLSDDAFGKLGAVLFLPRSVINTKVLPGGSVSETDATRSWDEAAVDIEAIAKQAAIQAGIGP
jgi:hypothetical protein